MKIYLSSQISLKLFCFIVGVLSLFMIAVGAPLIYTIFLSLLFFALVFSNFFQIKYLLDDQQFTLKSQFVTKDIKWKDVIEVSISDNGDSVDLNTVTLRSQTSYLSVLFHQVKTPELFLKDILTHLPQNCKVDSKLLSYIDQGRVYSEKLALKNVIGAVVAVIVMAIVILFIFRLA